MLLTFQRTACSYVCDARSACFGRFCAVFDGHGGEAAAMLAARRLLTFAEARTADSGGNAEALGKALASAFADCEHALALAAASQRSDPGGAVAVAAAVLPSAPPTLLLAWAGDATALLLRRGGAVRLTREHTLAEPSELWRVLLSGGEVVPPRTPAEAGRVKRCDANDLDHRGVPTRGIGDLQQGQPNAGDELLALVTDGVTAVLSDQARHGALRACLLRADACCRDNVGDCSCGGVGSARRPQGGKRSGGCCAPSPRHGRLHRCGGVFRVRRRVMMRGVPWDIDRAASSLRGPVKRLASRHAVQTASSCAPRIAAPLRQLSKALSEETCLVACRATPAPSSATMAAGSAAASELHAALAAGAPAEALVAVPSVAAFSSLPPAEAVALLRRACDDADVAAWLSSGAEPFLARLREAAPQARVASRVARDSRRHPWAAATAAACANSG